MAKAKRAARNGHVNGANGVAIATSSEPSDAAAASGAPAVEALAVEAAPVQLAPPPRALGMTDSAWVAPAVASAETGIPLRTVYNRMDSGAIPHKMAGGQQVVLLGAARALARERAGVAEPRAGNAVNATPIGNPDREALDPDTFARVVRLRQEGRSPLEIATDHGVPTRLVKIALKESAALEELAATSKGADRLGEVEKRLAALEEAITLVHALAAHVQALPIPTRAGFTCERCGTNGTPLVPVRCGRCGTPHVWGWR